jgi:membrane-bound lytic murein transglycosylase B
MRGSTRTRVAGAVLAVAGVLGAAVLTGWLVMGLSDGERTDAASGITTTAPAARPLLLETPPPAAADGGTEAAVAGISTLPDAAWAERTAAATGVPLRALLAYAGAELRLRAEQPTCGLGWNTLAAIGWVESEHGSIHGGTIGPDGLISPEIVGVPLDGAGVEAIADTDGGLLDGDTVWDRAVGPMQFIPGTWEQFAADGDGDGRAVVHRIDDAVLTAARYLCASGGDLRDPADWIAAVSSYNSSIDYNRRVAEAADSYAAGAEGQG